MVEMLVKNHRAFSQPVRETPGLIPGYRADLRVKLIEEEKDELREAWEKGDELNFPKELCDLVYVIAGTCVEYGLYDWGAYEENIAAFNPTLESFVPASFGIMLESEKFIKRALNVIDENSDIEKIKEALAQMFLACYDIIIDSGLQDIFPELFKAVHESNMTKLGEDGKAIISKNGKYLKGPNYKKPDLLPILKKSGV